MNKKYGIYVGNDSLNLKFGQTLEIVESRFSDRYLVTTYEDKDKFFVFKCDIQLCEVAYNYATRPMVYNRLKY